MVEEPVITRATAVDVVIAAKGEQASLWQDSAERVEEVQGAFVGGAGEIDVAEMDDDVGALGGQEGGDLARFVGAGAPVGEQGDAQGRGGGRG